MVGYIWNGFYIRVEMCNMIAIGLKLFGWIDLYIVKDTEEGCSLT